MNEKQKQRNLRIAEVLRSGEFVRTRSTYNDAIDAYCCLKLQRLLRSVQHIMTKKQKERNLRLAEALESNRFARAATVLYSTKSNGYCCLGVACKLLQEEEGLTPAELRWINLGLGLPKTNIMKYYGWYSNNPRLKIGDYEELATYFNDKVNNTREGYCFSWDEIAEGFRNLTEEER